MDTTGPRKYVLIREVSLFQRLICTKSTVYLFKAVCLCMYVYVCMYVCMLMYPK